MGLKKYSQKFKHQAIVKFINRGNKSIEQIAASIGTSSKNLYRWKNELDGMAMKKKSIKKTINDWSNEEKLQALLDTTSMTENELGAYIRSNGLYSTDLENFKKEIVSSSPSSKGRPKLDPEIVQLRKDKIKLERDLSKTKYALAEQSARIILLKKSHEIWGGSRGRRISKPDKLISIVLISEATKNGCRIKISCRDLEIDFKTYCRWKVDAVDKRKGPLSKPKNSLSHEERKEILQIAKSHEYMDYSPWIIVAKLADKGKYIASESSFYKILNENKMLKHRGKSKVKNMYRPEPLIAFDPNMIWTWDITYLKTLVRGQYFYLYLFLDIFSRKITGFDIHEEEAMEYSSELVKKLCVNEGIKKGELTLHSDNGGAMKGATMLATLEKLGVAASFSRPRVSNDNPYSESLFKTLKYCPKYPDRFKSITEAKSWVIKFINWYNNHPHSGIKFVTPNERHQGLDIEILERRKLVYLKAKYKNPERWGGRKIRNWNREEKVYLNYLQKKKEVDTKKVSQEFKSGSNNPKIFRNCILITSQKDLGRLNGLEKLQRNTYVMNSRDMDLHAKMYFGVHENGTDIYIGSANCTMSAWTGDNVEANIKYLGPKSSYDQFKKEFIFDDENNPRNWLIPYESAYISEQDEKTKEKEKIENKLDLAQSMLAMGEFFLDYEPGKCKISYKGERNTLIDGVTGNLKVIGVQGKVSVNKVLEEGREFNEVKKSDISSFINIILSYKGQKREFCTVAISNIDRKSRNKSILKQTIKDWESFWEYLGVLLDFETKHKDKKTPTNGDPRKKHNNKNNNKNNGNSRVKLKYLEPLLLGGVNEPEMIEKIETALNILEQSKEKGVKQEELNMFRGFWKQYKQAFREFQRYE